MQKDERTLSSASSYIERISSGNVSLGSSLHSNSYSVFEFEEFGVPCTRLLVSREDPFVVSACFSHGTNGWTERDDLGLDSSSVDDKSMQFCLQTSIDGLEEPTSSNEDAFDLGDAFTTMSRDELELLLVKTVSMYPESYEFIKDQVLKPLDKDTIDQEVKEAVSSLQTENEATQLRNLLETAKSYSKCLSFKNSSYILESICTEILAMFSKQEYDDITVSNLFPDLENSWSVFLHQLRSVELQGYDRTSLKVLFKDMAKWRQMLIPVFGPIFSDQLRDMKGILKSKRPIAEATEDGSPCRHVLDMVLQSLNQTSIFRSWMVCLNPNTKALEERLIAVTNYRVIALKLEDRNGTFVHQITTNVSLLELESLSMRSHSKVELAVVFANSTICILSPFAVEFCKAILFSFLAISSDTPRSMLPTLSLPDEYFDDMDVPTVDTPTALIASYLAHCDHKSIEAQVPVIDYLVSSIGSEQNVFNLRIGVSGLRKSTPEDLEAVCEVLCISPIFQSIVLEKMSFSVPTFRPVLSVIEKNSNVNSLEIRNLSLNEACVSIMLDSLKTSPHCLTSLTISNVSLGDTAIDYLGAALDKIQVPLKKLVLAKVGMGHPGFCRICEVLQKPKWATSIRELDISDNLLDFTQSSPVMSQTLFGLSRIETLSLAKTGLDMDIVLSGLSQNVNLVNLDVLDVSCNTLGAIASTTLIDIVQRCKLTYLRVAEVLVPDVDVFDSLLSLVSRDSSGAIGLDLSYNKFGPTVADRFERSFKSTSSSIYSLDLGYNLMSLEGITDLLKNLHSFTGLRTLVLDCNVASGMFTRVTDIGHALAGFVALCPTLESLSIRGDRKNSLKGGLAPLFEYLNDNTTLQELQVDRNEFTDDAFYSFSELVKKNKTLTSLSADSNDWTLRTLHDLANALNENSTLVGKSLIPMSDVREMFQESAKMATAVRELVLEMENKLLENEKKSSRFAPAPKANTAQRSSVFAAQDELTIEIERAEFDRSPSFALERMAFEIESREREEEELEQMKSIQESVNSMKISLHEELLTAGSEEMEE